MDTTHSATTVALLATSMIGMALLATVISSLAKFQEKGFHKIHKQLTESTNYVQEKLSIKLDPSSTIEEEQFVVSSIPCQNIVKELGFEYNSGEIFTYSQKRNLQQEEQCSEIK